MVHFWNQFAVAGRNISSCNQNGKWPKGVKCLPAGKGEIKWKRVGLRGDIQDIQRIS
jgi:hypothetical protein